MYPISKYNHFMLKTSCLKLKAKYFSTLYTLWNRKKMFVFFLPRMSYTSQILQKKTYDIIEQIMKDKKRKFHIFLRDSSHTYTHIIRHCRKINFKTKIVNSAQYTYNFERIFFLPLSKT